MGLICIGDVVVTPDGEGDVVDMNARRETVLVELHGDVPPRVRMLWYPMEKVTLIADLPDFSDPVAVEAYLAGEAPINNKPMPETATLHCCRCDCGGHGNCGIMSTNGFHTPMNLACQCVPRDCFCVGGTWNSD